MDWFDEALEELKADDWKQLDYEVFIDRVREVLTENDESIDEPEGIAAELLNGEILYKAEVSIDVVYAFAEKYGVSLDYLTGRSDRYDIN